VSWYFGIYLVVFVRSQELFILVLKKHTMRKRVFLLTLMVLPFMSACQDESAEIIVEEKIIEEKSGFATHSASMGAASRAGNEYN